MDATQRAIALLKNSDITVKVLQLPRRKTDSGELVKQDADDYIKNYGGEAFQSLMDRSANSVEYRLEMVRGKYDLDQDDQRAAYLQEAAEVIAGLNSPVEREIYGGRAAETARISREGMAQEVERLRKKKSWEARRKEERQSLTPTQMLQPKDRGLRYTNVRSARAEEGLLRVVLLDSEFFGQLEDLSEEQFSSPVLGKAFGLLRQRWREDKPVTLAAIDNQFSGEEMQMLTTAVQEPQPRHTAQAALDDDKRIILAESRRGTDRNGEDLAELSARYKQTKGYGG
jgi:DNA primase